MRLFEIDEDTQLVKLNKPWIQLVPEFSALIRRDKGSKGDSDGRYKLKATKEFTFIYFMVDFAAYTRDWEKDEKWKESLYAAQLEDKDIDEAVLKAMKKYEEVFLKSARSLKSYRALQKTLDQMDTYFSTINMAERNAKKELVHDPTQVVNSAKRMDEFYIALSNMSKRVEEELTAGAKTIRGTAELGDNETKKTSGWSEADIAEGSGRQAGGTISSKSFTDFSQILKQ